MKMKGNLCRLVLVKTLCSFWQKYLTWLGSDLGVPLLDWNNVGGQKARRFPWSGHQWLTGGSRACLFKGSPCSEGGPHLVRRMAPSLESCWLLTKPVRVWCLICCSAHLRSRGWLTVISTWQRRPMGSERGLQPRSSAESVAPLLESVAGSGLWQALPSLTSIHLAWLLHCCELISLLLA